MQTVVCMRWGDRFPVDYVNRLYRGVMRNVARPTRFVAFTDDPCGLDAGIEPREIPPIKLPATGLGGSPVAQARAVVAAHRPRPATCCSSISTSSSSARSTPFFDYEPGKLAHHPRLARQRHRQFLGHAAARRRRAASRRAVRARPAGASAGSTPTSRSTSAANPACRWCSGPGVVSRFKAMMLPRFPFNLFKNVTLPEGARVVVFTGHPRPHEA